MLCNKLLVRFRACRRGVVAFEFAMVGAALMMLLVGFLQVGYCLFAQSVLDQAAAGVARQFWTGTNKNAVYTDGNGKSYYDPNSDTNGFKTQTVCPQLANILDCTKVTVLNYPVHDFQGTSSSTTPDTGGSKTTMLLQLVYTSPLPVWPILGGSSSNPLLITATIPYVNEY